MTSGKKYIFLFCITLSRARLCGARTSGAGLCLLAYDIFHLFAEVIRGVNGSLELFEDVVEVHAGPGQTKKLRHRSYDFAFRKLPRPPDDATGRR